MRKIVLGMILTTLLGLFGCGDDTPPFMVDGPGMVYVDSEHRTAYANIVADLGDAETNYDKYFAYCYLGEGDIGKSNIEKYVYRLFAERLLAEEIEAIAHYDFGGDSYYLVVPRYEAFEITSFDEGYDKVYDSQGKAFTINAGNVKIFMDSHGGNEFQILEGEGIADEKECAWDISGFEVFQDL